MLISALSFSLLVGFVIWFTDGRVFDVVMQFEAAGVATNNPAVSCRNPKNKNTPYCQERKARTEGNWQSISRHSGGKGAAFSLNSNR